MNVFVIAVTVVKLIARRIIIKKIAPRKGGCTNQIPLTIKPYPMKNQI